MATRSLRSETWRICFDLERLAGGKITNYNPTGGGGIPDSRAPGTYRERDTEPGAYWWRRFWACKCGHLRERHGLVAIDDGLFVRCQDGCPCRAYAASDAHAKEAVRDGAKQELDTWKRRPQTEVVVETQDELAQRVIREGRGWTLEQIALHCRCTERFARNARLKAGADLETGVIAKPVSDSTDERQHAVELAERGLSVRQIAMITKLSKSTIHRLVA